jgi:two-component sensor histidine kinase
MGASDVQDVSIAVSEVITNAVMHAFPAGGHGTITVRASAGDHEFVVSVLDDGVGMRPRTDSPGAGLGLAIAGSVARSMVVELSARGGTEVRMTFAPTG